MLTHHYHVMASNNELLGVAFLACCVLSILLGILWMKRDVMMGLLLVLTAFLFFMGFSFFSDKVTEENTSTVCTTKGEERGYCNGTT